MGLIAFAGSLSWVYFLFASSACRFWFSGYMVDFSVWWVFWFGCNLLLLVVGVLVFGFGCVLVFRNMVRGFGLVFRL